VVVEDLAVEADHRLAVGAEHRLGPAGEVEDRQAPVAEAERAVDVQALAVGPAMAQARGHGGQQRRVMATDHPGDPAHRREGNAKRERGGKRVSSGLPVPARDDET
jgi:hypothetical protein